MTALVLENVKLIVLFILIGSVIGLSHLGGGAAMPSLPQALRNHCRPAPAGR
jgi:hypothetical protein